MKVTPGRVAPIMPKATIYQGEFRLPIKKDAESAWCPVNCEISKINPK
jgi:hypothetical protein